MISRVLRILAKPPKVNVRNMSSHGNWKYRTYPDPPSTREVVIAKVLGGFMWFWIFWHCYYQSDKLFGAFPDVDPKLFTDEELGIPADDEE